MTSTKPVFCSASDDALVDLIRDARRRLMVVSPALTKPVAEAVLDRIREISPPGSDPDHDPVQITLVLDDSPEAYRLGYGEVAKNLNRFRKAADQRQIRFRVEPGLRIGVVISDEDSLIFSPTPQLVEAPVSASVVRANAIRVSGREADRLARASGWAPPTDRPAEEDTGSESAAPTPPTAPEIGVEPFTSAVASAVSDELEQNPPEPFDISRRLRVFSSKVKYVEVTVTNAKVGARRVKLPAELLGIVNDDLKERFDGKLGPPPELLEPLPVTIETADGSREPLQVDEKWFKFQRKQVEAKYTFTIRKYGRLIYEAAWPAFLAEMDRLERNLKAYHAALLEAAKESRDKFRSTLFDEFLPNLRRNPPEHLTARRGGYPPTEEDLRWYLEREIERATSILEIGCPEVRIVRKNVAPESVGEPDFQAGLEEDLSPHEIKQLFTHQDAAPSREGAAAAQPQRGPLGGGLSA